MRAGGRPAAQAQPAAARTRRGQPALRARALRRRAPCRPGAPLGPAGRPAPTRHAAHPAPSAGPQPRLPRHQHPGLRDRHLTRLPPFLRLLRIHRPGQRRPGSAPALAQRGLGAGGAALRPAGLSLPERHRLRRRLLPGPPHGRAGALRPALQGRGGPALHLHRQPGHHHAPAPAAAQRGRPAAHQDGHPERQRGHPARPGPPRAPRAAAPGPGSHRPAGPRPAAAALRPAGGPALRDPAGPPGHPAPGGRAAAPLSPGAQLPAPDGGHAPARPRPARGLGYARHDGQLQAHPTQLHQPSAGAVARDAALAPGAAPAGPARPGADHESRHAGPRPQEDWNLVPGGTTDVAFSQPAQCGKRGVQRRAG